MLKIRFSLNLSLSFAALHHIIISKPLGALIALIGRGCQFCQAFEVAHSLKQWIFNDSEKHLLMSTTINLHTCEKKKVGGPINEKGGFC